MTTRLNASHRSVLNDFMSKVVDCPAEKKAMQTAYDKAMPIAKKLVEAQYPAADMLILAKYQVALPDKCIRIQLSDGDVQQFNFNDGDEPKVPGSRYGHDCRNRMYVADAKQSDAIEKAIDASKAYVEALKAKRRDYENFIASALNFEQVTEVWPEAVQLEPRIKANLPAAVSPDVLARITADSKKRLKAA